MYFCGSLSSIFHLIHSFISPQMKLPMNCKQHWRTGILFLFFFFFFYFHQNEKNNRIRKEVFYIIILINHQIILMLHWKMAIESTYINVFGHIEYWTTWATTKEHISSSCNAFIQCFSVFLSFFLYLQLILFFYHQFIFFFFITKF